MELWQVSEVQLNLGVRTLTYHLVYDAHVLLTTYMSMPIIIIPAVTVERSTLQLHGLDLPSDLGHTQTYSLSHL